MSNLRHRSIWDVLHTTMIELMNCYHNTIQTHGTSSLINKMTLTHDLNQKLYGNQVVMPIIVHNLNLSSGCVNNLAIFSVKDVILHMVTNKGDAWKILSSWKDRPSTLPSMNKVCKVGNITTWL